MFLHIYTFLYSLTLPFILPREFFKRSKNIRKQWLKEKFALYKEISFENEKKKRIWIHAVSVGEVIAVSRLIKELSKKYNIILSTITDTGQKVAYQRFKDLPVKVIYLPFDYPFAIKRVIKILKPSILVIAETEIWPNLVTISSKYIPVLLINARLSENSFKGYKKLKRFFKDVLNSFSIIGVQEDIYKNRFKKLGVPEEKIVITGNTKFDIEIKEIKFPWENSLPHPIITAGSTHYPEEELILENFLKVCKTGSLLIVPRHPQRFREVEDTIKNFISKNKDITFYKTTEISDKKDIQMRNKVILLVDQMGILGALYRICDIAIIGGSFIPHGGQNPLEAIYWKKPVIFGPSMENFPFIKEFLEIGGCIQVNKEDLENTLKFLIENKEKAKELGEKAYQLYLSKTRATKKSLVLIEQFISK